MVVSMKYFKQIAFLIILFNVIFSSKLYASFTDLKPINLRTEYKVNPVIDSPKPRFSWELTSTKRGQNQTAFQIMIASSAGLLAVNKADIWDSKKINSNSTKKS